jgi:hypothetical protein
VILSYIYRGGGLIPVENMSKMRFSSFPHRKYTKTDFRKSPTGFRTSRLSRAYKLVQGESA